MTKSKVKLKLKVNLILLNFWDFIIEWVKLDILINYLYY
jgi:hypothetical protein